MIISKHRRTKIVRSHARKRVFRKPPPVQQPDAVVLSYSKLLLGEVKEMENLVNDYLLPKLNFLTVKADGENIVVRADDIDVTAKIAGLFHRMKMKFFGEAGHDHEPKLINYTKKITNKIVKPMLSRANDHNKRQFSKGMQTVLAVDPLKAEPFLRDQVALATKANVDLIKTIPQDYFKDIEGLVTHAARSGESIDTLKDKIHARTGNEEVHCRLIARDQISKFNGSLHQKRAENNGIKRYIWHTVKDQGVRSDHDFLDGKIFFWDDPPVTVRAGKRAGEKNHPGMDINCFPSGTMISTPNGQKPIEEIKIGDSVHSHGGVQEVVELHKNNFSGELTGLQFLHKTVWVTPNHKIFAKGRGWIRADQLKVGDELVKLEEVFPAGCFSEKAVRDIEHPHPDLINQEIMTNRVDLGHGPLNLKDGVQVIKEKINDIIWTVSPVRLFNSHVWRVFNMQDIHPSRAIDFSVWRNASMSVCGTTPLRCREAVFSPFRIVDPLRRNSFTAIPNGDGVVVQDFADCMTSKASFLGNHAVRSVFVNVFSLDPLIERFANYFLNAANIIEKSTLSLAFFGAKAFSAISVLTGKAFKFLAATLADNRITSNFLFTHKSSCGVGCKFPAIQHHFTIQEIKCKKFDGDVFNFGVSNSMSYFAEGVLVANCRCYAENIWRDLLDATA